MVSWNGAGARGARKSGGRAADATFMGLLYNNATQMSTGHLHFFSRRGAKAPLADRAHWDAADEGFGFLAGEAVRAV